MSIVMSTRERNKLEKEAKKFQRGEVAEKRQ